MSEDDNSSSTTAPAAERAAEEATGAVGRLRSALAKATHAVVGIVKKDDAGGATAATADGAATENATRMKAAVRAARKAQSGD